MGLSTGTPWTSIPSHIMVTLGYLDFISTHLSLDGELERTHSITGRPCNLSKNRNRPYNLLSEELSSFCQKHYENDKVVVDTSRMVLLIWLCLVLAQIRLLSSLQTQQSVMASVRTKACDTV